MADFDRDPIKIPRQNGCEYSRPADGGHAWWNSPIASKRFAVPYHIKSRHTANAIPKQAGIGKQF
jgi:hypothetical protein